MNDEQLYTLADLQAFLTDKYNLGGGLASKFLLFRRLY